MSKTHALLLCPLLIIAVGCERKSEAQVQAEAAAKAAEEKVAALEARLAEAKGAKAAADVDAQTHEHLSRGQQKALERQIAEARQRAAAAKQAAVEAPKAAAAPAPKPVVVTVPEGTPLVGLLAGDLSTDKAQAGDGFEATLDQAVVVEGRTIWPAGAKLKGVVTQSVPAGRLASGKGLLAVKLIEVAGEGIETDTFAVHGDARGERNAKAIGGGAALGALVGILSDRDNRRDHAVAGAILGAAAGTAVAAGTANTVIKISATNPITFKLTAAERITLKQP